MFEKAYRCECLCRKIISFPVLMDTLATKLSIHGMRLEYMYSYLESANISLYCFTFTTAPFLWLSFIPPFMH